MTTKIQGVIALFAILLAMSLLGSHNTDEAERKVERYCDKVALWKATDGDAGWPDYKSKFEEVCK